MRENQIQRGSFIDRYVSIMLGIKISRIWLPTYLPNQNLIKYLAIIKYFYSVVRYR